jgi:hypothetical protein
MPYYPPAPHGGATVTAGTYAGSRPASPAVGDLYVVTDGWWTEEYTGSAWAPYGPRVPLTDPLLRTWAWFNQGTATVDTSRGAVILQAPGSSGNQVRGYEESFGAGTYTVTMGFLPALIAGGQAPGAGLLLRDSVGGKFIFFFMMDNNTTPTIRIDQWNSAGSFSAQAFAVSGQVATGPGLHWLRVQDNGTNRLYSVSADGVTWAQVYSEARTTWCTPDRRGPGIYAQNSTYPQTLTVLSWAVT